MKRLYVRGRVVQMASPPPEKGTIWYAECDELLVGAFGESPEATMEQMVRTLRMFIDKVVEEHLYSKVVEPNHDKLSNDRGAPRLGDYALTKSGSFVVAMALENEFVLA